MRFRNLLLSVATAGTTLAFGFTAPASAQETYSHRSYAHTHHAYARHHHYANEGRYVVVHAQSVPAPAPSYAWGPVAAVGTVVGGTGQAVGGVFTGAGAIVGSFLGGVLGGTAALFGSPPTYSYGAPFAAPFNAAGAVAAAPFQVVGGALGGPTPAHVVY